MVCFLTRTRFAGSRVRHGLRLAVRQPLRLPVLEQLLRPSHARSDRPITAFRLDAAGLRLAGAPPHLHLRMPVGAAHALSPLAAFHPTPPPLLPRAAQEFSETPWVGRGVDPTPPGLSVQPCPPPWHPRIPHRTIVSYPADVSSQFLRIFD